MIQPTLLLKDPTETLTCVPTPGNLIGRLRGVSVAIQGAHILDVAPYPVLAERYDLSPTRIVDVRGKVLAPGFVDSHTHVVFGGSRVQEYAARMTRTPAEIRALGIPTGITATMAMTRAATEDELVASAAARVHRMLRAGTTTVESKSGYGLSLEHELKILRVNQRLAQSPTLPDILSTFLGAHAFPPDKSHAAYVDEILHEMLPAVQAESLADFCDVYIDEGYFTLPQTRRILETARALGFQLKIHADQYGALGGSELAADLGVVSADHLNYTSPETMWKLADAGVVGVLMPLIDFAVQHPRPFDARAMLDAGMTLALATDICPGGWTESMQLVMQFACRQYHLSPEEALYAATVGGARALALHDRGALASGLRADIQIWDVPVFEEVIYRLGGNVVENVLLKGRFILAE
jgi:imidazolonepropionase